jgi:hypothetical protein
MREETGDVAAGGERDGSVAFAYEADFGGGKVEAEEAVEGKV